MSGITLWQFLLDLLLSPPHAHLIRWTSDEGEFKLLDAETVAKLWGLTKNHNEKMNYDKLSRALRYYYRKNIIQKVLGQKFVYRFVSFPEDVRIRSRAPKRKLRGDPSKERNERKKRKPSEESQEPTVRSPNVSQAEETPWLRIEEKPSSELGPCDLSTHTLELKRAEEMRRLFWFLALNSSGGKCAEEACPSLCPMFLQMFSWSGSSAFKTQGSIDLRTKIPNEPQTESPRILSINHHQKSQERNESPRSLNPHFPHLPFNSPWMQRWGTMAKTFSHNSTQGAKRGNPDV